MPSNTPADQIARLQEQLADAKRRNDTPAEVDALLSLAEAAWNQGDPGGASLHYKLAERVIRGSQACLDRLHEALGGQGRCLRKRAQYQEALECFLQAEQAAQEHAGEVDAALWKVYQAAVHRLMEAYEAAHEALDAAAALLQPPDDPDLRFWQTLLERAEADRLKALAEREGQAGLLALAEGDPEGAEEAYRRALDFAEAAEDPVAVTVWATNLGNACSRRRSYAAADACYVAAQAAARASGDASKLLNMARNRSIALGRAHRNEDAANVLIEAAQEIPWPPACLSLLDEALSYLQRAGAWARCCAVGAEAEQLAVGQGADPSYLGRLRQQMEEARRWRDDPPGPIREGPTALDIHLPRRMADLVPAKDANDALAMADVAHLLCDVQWGLAAPNEQHWRAVLSETYLRHRVVGEAMTALCEQDMPLQSLELSQRYKSIGFALPTLRRMRQRSAPHPEAAAYLEKYEDLRKAVEVLEGPGQPDCFLVLEQARAAGEALLEAGELLRERDPILQARMGGLVQPDELIDALPLADPVAIVDLFVTGDATVGHIIMRTGRGVQVIPLLVPVFTAAHVMELSEIWHAAGIPHTFGGRQAEGLAQISKVLHDRLFCNLARTLSQWGITQLILIPDLLTRHLPLHLAWVCGKEIEVPGVDTEGAEHLCEVMPVEYAPCLQAVAASQVFKRPRELSKIISIADPRSDLPGARQTSEWLGAQLTDASPAFESLVGAAGTRAALKRGLEQADVVLVGTHGHFDAERPEESYLALYDGPWKMTTLLDRPALGRRPVVVLSACEVGAVAATTDEAVASGIPGTLISAEAASVLASLWPVEDLSMGYLIERFLRHISHRGYRPAAALFRAVRDLRRLSREDALARCRHVLDELERKGAPDKQLIQLENLIEWIEDTDAPHPFASPVFWGGVVIVGSGWHLPAGAVVGAIGDVLEIALHEVGTLHQAEELIQDGRYEEARRKVEGLLPQLEGVYRARALTVLARAVAWGSSPWSARSATRKALKLLSQAERLALAEEDTELLEFLHNLQASIERRRGNHVETNEP